MRSGKESYINGTGHMTKMATFKNLLLQKQKSYDLETWHVALGLKLYKAYINDDPGLTLAYFTCFCSYSRPRYQVSVAKCFDKES